MVRHRPSETDRGGSPHLLREPSFILRTDRAVIEGSKVINHNWVNKSTFSCCLVLEMQIIILYCAISVNNKHSRKEMKSRPSQLKLTEGKNTAI